MSILNKLFGFGPEPQRRGGGRGKKLTSQKALDDANAIINRAKREGRDVTDRETQQLETLKDTMEKALEYEKDERTGVTIKW